jgi:hypothetical protein
LTLGQIHSALAYSADHEEEMRRQIDDGERLAEELRPQLESAALREKLAAAAARRGDAG